MEPTDDRGLVAVAEGDALWVDTEGVFGAVALLRAATAWSGSYVAVEVAEVGRPGADDALGRAGFLLRNLPRRYSEELAVAAEAITQGAVDVQVADGLNGEAR